MCVTHKDSEQKTLEVAFLHVAYMYFKLRFFLLCFSHQSHTPEKAQAHP